LLSHPAQAHRGGVAHPAERITNEIAVCQFTARSNTTFRFVACETRHLHAEYGCVDRVIA